MYMRPDGRGGVGYLGDYEAAVAPQTQAALALDAQILKTVAEGVLVAHYHTGLSRVDVEKGLVDHYVTLGDDHPAQRTAYIEGRVSPLRTALRVVRGVL